MTRSFHEPDVTEARRIMDPVISQMVDSLPICQFSTKRFIEVMLERDEFEVAYKAALATLGDEPEMALMALHGQVISVSLRNDARLDFAGFVRDDQPDHIDPFSHSSWWRKEL
tara:strand:- start:7060 stop:7398 length:339 start_codon:yes stop_codon:yes gene_type:complete